MNIFFLLLKFLLLFCYINYEKNINKIRQLIIVLVSQMVLHIICQRSFVNLFLIIYKMISFCKSKFPTFFLFLNCKCLERRFGYNDTETRICQKAILFLVTTKKLKKVFKKQANQSQSNEELGNKRQQYFPHITLLDLPVNQLIKSIAHTGCLKFQWNTHPKVAPLGIDGDGRKMAPELLRRRRTNRPTRASSTEDKPKIT